MGKIYYIIGKSSTGKDSIEQRLVADPELQLREITQYTTRPKRDGETEGVEYHFITEKEEEKLRKAGKIIEMRAYNTVHGIWKYMMVDDGAVDLEKHDYVAVGTLASYNEVRRFFPEGKVVPIYVDVEKGERLYRAVIRERKSAYPKYEELCRRFLADEADFDEAHLKAVGLMNEAGEILNRIENRDLSETVEKIKAFIKEN